MLIRSQDRMSLVKFENIVVNINNINGKEIICWSQMNPGEDEYISLGHYSTKAKAMKVLDMIQAAYVEYEMFLQTFMGIASVRVTTTEKEILDKKKKDIKKKAIFQMPQDSEVEEWAI